MASQSSLTARSGPTIIRGSPLRALMCEGAAAFTSGNEIRADVAERHQRLTVAEGGEPSQPTARDILEQHPLNRIFGAELEDVARGPGRSDTRSR